MEGPYSRKDSFEGGHKFNSFTYSKEGIYSRRANYSRVRLFKGVCLFEDGCLFKGGRLFEGVCSFDRCNYLKEGVTNLGVSVI